MFFYLRMNLGYLISFAHLLFLEIDYDVLVRRNILLLMERYSGQPLQIQIVCRSGNVSSARIPEQYRSY